MIRIQNIYYMLAYAFQVLNEHGYKSIATEDFENTADDIKKAFLPFYETTIMEGDTDINKVYDLRNKIAGYMIYNYNDVHTFMEFMSSQSGKAQSEAAIGRLTGMLGPVITRYKELSENEQYSVRDYIKRFNGAYSYVTQLVQLHDKDLFEEYQYDLNLIRLLPRNRDPFENIDDKVKLEYANLTETFKGAITLNEKPPVIVPINNLDAKVPNKKKDTLQNIIDNWPVYLTGRCGTIYIMLSARLLWRRRCRHGAVFFFCAGEVLRRRTSFSLGIIMREAIFCSRRKNTRISRRKCCRASG